MHANSHYSVVCTPMCATTTREGERIGRAPTARARDRGRRRRVARGRVARV